MFFLILFIWSLATKKLTIDDDMPKLEYLCRCIGFELAMEACVLYFLIWH